MRNLQSLECKTYRLSIGRVLVSRLEVGLSCKLGDEGGQNWVMQFRKNLSSLAYEMESS